MRIARDQRVLWRRTLRGILVLAPGSGDLKVLAPPGDAVWDALARPISEAELSKQLAERFGVDSSVIESDVRVMAEELRTAGLLIDVDFGSRPSDVWRHFTE